MKFNKKIAMLALASTVCVAAGALSVNASIASAADESSSASFYMAVGAQVNKTNYEYGGIRWTTTIEAGYQPETNTESYEFGTLIMPTTVYETVSDGKYVEVADAVNLAYQTVTTTTLTEDLVFYSAIKYDDLVQDGATEAQVKEAYKLELTAISYAKSGENYYYATAEDTSRSARQVANAAMLAGELDDLSDSVQEELDQKNKIKGYVQGTRNVADYSEDYIDVTELKAGTTQAITSDTFASINWENVEEVVVGAKNIGTQYTQSGSTVSLKAVPSNTQTYYTKAELDKANAEGREAKGNYAWVSVFMNNGDVYSVPAKAADGVISTLADIKNKLGNGQLTADDASTEDVNEATYETQENGYYVMTNNIYTGVKVFEGLGTNAKVGGLKNSVFDGQGYTFETIYGYVGIFGNVENSYIINVGFEGKPYSTSADKVQRNASVVASYMSDSILENVYVKLEDWCAYGGSAVAANMSKVTMRSCFVDSSVALPNEWANPTSLTDYYEMPLGAISGNTDTMSNVFENTIVLSGMPLFAKLGNTTNITVSGTSSWKYRARYEIADVWSKDYVTEVTTVGGQTVTIGGNEYAITDSNKNSLSKNIYYTGVEGVYRNFFFRTSDYKQITGGVTRYEKASDMVKAYTDSNNTLFDGYSNKYWSVTDNVLTWNNA